MDLLLEIRNAVISCVRSSIEKAKDPNWESIDKSINIKTSTDVTPKLCCQIWNGLKGELYYK